MNTRIKEVRQGAELTQAQFADRLNISRNYVALMEIGDRVPSDRTIADICREFGVSESWLRTGNGEKAPPKSLDEEFAETMSQIQSSEDELIKKIIKAYWALDDKEKAAIRKLIDGLCEK